MVLLILSTLLLEVSGKYLLKIIRGKMKEKKIVRLTETVQSAG
jgi:hypothetical protein